MATYVRAGAVRVRLVAEAAFVPGRARWDDWGRYEAVVNHVMRPYPVSAILAYDVLSTPPAMLVSAQATHPYLARGSTHAINPFYVEPAVYLGRTAPDRKSLESTPPVVEIDDLTDLGGTGVTDHRPSGHWNGDPAGVPKKGYQRGRRLSLTLTRTASTYARFSRYVAVEAHAAGSSGYIRVNPRQPRQPPEQGLHR